MEGRMESGRGGAVLWRSGRGFGAEAVSEPTFERGREGPQQGKRGGVLTRSGGAGME